MPTPTYTDPPSSPEDGGADSTPTSRAAEMGRKAAAAIDDRRESVARGIDSAASTLHEKAESLPGGGRISSAAHSTAEAMEKTADYLRDQDLEAMLSDVRDVVKKHPGATLLTAAAVGFLLARAFSRD